MSANAPPLLELNDVQGIVVRGYAHLRGARFFLLRIDDPARTRAWIAALMGKIMPASTNDPPEALHLAFTRPGLAALGLAVSDVRFSNEFTAGMAARGRLLGDVDESQRSSAPARWLWGKPGESEVDVALLLYAKTEAAVAKVAVEVRTGNAVLPGFTAGGLHVIAELTTTMLTVGTSDEGAFPREHFGFRDGLTQPSLLHGNDSANRGSLRPSTPENTVMPGEFILGYPNEYDQIPDSPIVAARTDVDGHLAPATQHKAGRDFGRNGSYLVIRQLEQAVADFWRCITTASNDAADRDLIAAKLVGRWRSGAPLVVFPDRDPELATRAELRKHESFSFVRDDAGGRRCPLGAHIRRANPRDLTTGSKGRETRDARFHRLIRRGRSYGAPLHPSLDPARMLEAAENGGAPKGERGIHFLCFNANIRRQFEFMQEMWLNYPQLADLPDEVDPIAGYHPQSRWSFTIQSEPVARPIAGLRRFVHVRGGAYFFMPGLAALRYLASPRR